MGLVNAFKTDGEMLNNIMAWPEKFLYMNFVEAYHKINFMKSLLNTLIVGVVGVSGMICFGSLAGYKLARTNSRLSRFIFGLFIMSMLIPFHSIMITLTKIAKNTYVQGSTYGLGIIYIGLGVPMAIFLFHGFVKSIPYELEEAAIIDGCNDLKVFQYVIFPLLKPITATVAILNLLWIWNDFLLPLLMITDSDHYTILLSINMLFGQYNNNDWTAILASLILSMLPVVTIYLVLQKYIVKGISDGAIKG
jgi:raffinose/stachyose/melibiose transport system permease protein